jgi:hypothetical protein
MSWRTKALVAAAKGHQTAEVALIAAYQASFGRGDHSEMVLADLAVHLGFFQAEDRGLSIEDANYQNGRRSAFLHILQHLTLPEAELEALVEAARLEAASYEPPGS